MSFKKLVSLAVLAMVSANAGAVQLYKAKIVSEKITNTDGSKGRIGTNTKTVVFPKMQEGSFNVHTSVMLDSAATATSTPIEISSNHNTYISNLSDTTESYYVFNTVCSQTSDASTHCVFYHREVQVEAGGYYLDDTRPLLTMKYSQPGRYFTWATTAIFNAHSDSSMTPTVSEAGAAVDVS